MRIRHFLVPAVALSLALTACGGSDKTALGTTTSTSQATTTTASAPSAATDKATARKLVLVKSDVPAGWTEDAATVPSTDEKAAEDQINACVGMAPNAQIQSADVRGDSFIQGNNNISSGADALKTADLVQQDLRGYTNPKNFSCISNLFNAGIKSSVVNEDKNATVSSNLTKLDGITADDTEFALRITSTIVVNGQTTLAYTDLLGIDIGRFEIADTISYIGSIPPANLERSLLEAGINHFGGTTTA